MALKSQRDMAVRTDRDKEREARYEAMHLQWAKFDAAVADALDEHGE